MKNYSGNSLSNPKISGFIQPKWIVIYHSTKKLNYFLKNTMIELFLRKKYDNLSFNYLILKNKKIIWTTYYPTQKIVSLPNLVQYCNE
jgi:hypothetical protein